MGRTLKGLRANAVEIFNAAVKAVDAVAAVRRCVRVTESVLEVANRSYSLADFQKIYILGAGKAAIPMAQALETLLGKRLSGGVVVTKYGQARPLRKTRVIEAAHPIPDRAGVDGARQITAITQRATEHDLLFFVVSGGGSALLPYPVEGLTLEDKQDVTNMLLRSGATIRETNTLRRHLSRLKGGKLARLAFPAQLVTLIVSDVVGDTLEDIASGPTAPDPSCYADCWQIIRKYQLQDAVPADVRAILDRGIRGDIAETVKAGDIAFAKVQNVIIANNRLATEAARSHAETLGYRTRILSNDVEGESREVGKQQAAMFRKVLTEPLPEPICSLSGGETTVTVRGDGKGGRNQEFALAAAIELAGASGVVLLSAGTDGIDGPTDAAGAIIDGATLARGQVQGYDASQFLARNDSYNFLHATGDLLVIGPTHTNVMDIQVMLAG